MHILHPLRLHAGGTVNTTAPVLHHRLVAADMDILRGEQIHHLIQHGLQKAESLFPPGAEVPRERQGLTVGGFAGHAGVGAVDLHAVAGHLYLRDYVYAALRRIGHYLPYVILGIPAPVRVRHILAGKRIAPFLPVEVALAYAPSGLVGELRICIYAYAPASRVGQMQMQHVQFEQRHEVHLLEKELLALEAAGFVYHQTAVAETRIIGYAATGGRVAQGLQLADGLAGTQGAGGRKRAHHDSAGPDFQGISLFPHKIRKAGDSFGKLSVGLSFNYSGGVRHAAARSHLNTYGTRYQVEDSCKQDDADTHFLNFTCADASLPFLSAT